MGLPSFGGSKKRSDILYSLLLENEALERLLVEQGEKLVDERQEFLKHRLKDIGRRQRLIAELFNDDTIKDYVRDVLSDDDKVKAAFSRAEKVEGENAAKKNNLTPTPFKKEVAMLLIIDNQSSYIKKFRKSFLLKQTFKYRFFKHNEPIVLEPEAEVKGVILSGGKGNPWKPLNLTANFVALMNFNVPVLGFCLGHEIIAASYQAEIKKLPSYQWKKERVAITEKNDPIFEGIGENEVILQKKHRFHVSALPETFVSLGRSRVCPNEIIRHKDKPVYGFQAHPEVSGENGMLMVKNFLKICGIEAS